MTLAISFEVFPPKTADGLETLRETVGRLASVEPTFVSVTYGAGGTDRERSFAAIAAVAAGGVAVAGHVTCVGQPRYEVETVIDRYAGLGVRRVVALRGDPPSGVDGTYEPHPDGFARTEDLVAAVAARDGIDVTVSAYPERHPQSPSIDHDLDVLAGKVAAGANRAVTQMFFDNAAYLSYRDEVAARGIDVPIVPGIFPIHSFGAVARFAERCGATIPAAVAARFDGVDVNESHAVAADVAAEQIAELAAHGVDRVHLYTLNRAELALAVCERLDVPQLTGTTR